MTSLLHSAFSTFLQRPTENKEKAMINFYVEYFDKNHHKHYAVNKYEMRSGWVWTMSDYVF